MNYRPISEVLEFQIILFSGFETVQKNIWEFNIEMFFESSRKKWRNYNLQNET